MLKVVRPAQRSWSDYGVTTKDLDLSQDEIFDFVNGYALAKTKNSLLNFFADLNRPPPLQLLFFDRRTQRELLHALDPGTTVLLDLPDSFFFRPNLNQRGAGETSIFNTRLLKSLLDFRLLVGAGLWNSVPPLPFFVNHQNSEAGDTTGE